MAVALFLERLARPIAEYGQPQIQDRLIQECDHSESRQFDVVRGIAAAPGFVVSELHGRPYLSAERRGVAHLLPMGPQTLADGKQFLEDEREIFHAPWRGLRIHRSSLQYHK
jgi:hypothetical protein